MGTELSPALGEAAWEEGGGVWAPRCNGHGTVGQFVEWGALPSLMSSLASGVLSGIQRGAAPSHPWSNGCVGWVVSHRRGTWTPREGPEGWSPLGAKAEAAGRAADILKNVEGLPHIVVHVGTRGLREADGLRLLRGQSRLGGGPACQPAGAAESAQRPRGPGIRRARGSDSRPTRVTAGDDLMDSGLSQDRNPPVGPGGAGGRALLWVS